MERLSLLCVLVALANVSSMVPASAISADLAKKCRNLASKAHPIPVAGSKNTGAAKAQREAYQTCIAKGDDTQSDNQVDSIKK